MIRCQCADAVMAVHEIVDVIMTGKIAYMKMTTCDGLLQFLPPA